MLEQFELKDVRGFVQIARAGSLTSAANETNTAKATLSNNLRRLEDALGVELFTRHKRGLKLTEAGRAFLDKSQRIFESCEIAANSAHRANNVVSGKLRIVASAEFGTSILGAASLILAQQHPELQFELRIFPTDNLLVNEVDFDCMIYIGTAPDSDYLCRKMGNVHYGLYASPNFVSEHGMPSDYDDIRGLPGVEYERTGNPEQWLVSDGQNLRAVDFKRRFSVNDYWMAKYYAVLGEGIAYLPDFFVHYEVEQNALVPILPGKLSSEIAAWVIYPQSRHQNTRVKLMVETLCSLFDQIILHPGYSLVPNIPGVQGNTKQSG